MRHQTAALRKPPTTGACRAVSDPLLVKHMRQLMLDFTIRTFKPEDVAQKPGRTAHGVNLAEPGGRARTQRVAGTKAGERGR